MPASISAFSTPSSSAPSALLIARERLIDTLLLARRKHPAGPNRLDDLCARYGIDNSRRTKHGALLDAEILAEVYLELIGARQAQLGLAESGERRATASDGVTPCARGPIALAAAPDAMPNARRIATSSRPRRECRCGRIICRAKSDGLKLCAVGAGACCICAILCR